MTFKLYLVATPIGNYNDITLRALDILKSVDKIICEEYKEARRLLSFHKIEKELISLNEHNEPEIAPGIIKGILNGKQYALISDCGTPLFSDPGHYLAELCISQNIELIPVPGANSLLPALTSSGLDIENFYYYGWLSAKSDIRKKELKELKNLKHLIVLLDTPYRLKKLLMEVNSIFGENQPIVLAYNLTMNDQKLFRGKAGNILKDAEKRNLKGEFVLLIDNRKSNSAKRRK
jgi:16S rRNA (cytidine1402-2'-O)-methyltransferase